MNGGSNPATDERLALERARLEGELELKRRELELKADEQARSRWTSPLMVAAATAILGLFVNLLLGQHTARQQLALEREKRQGELVVKAISTDDTEAARRNLKFLIDTRLLPDEDGQMSAALEDPERIPVLPSSTGRPVRELPVGDPRRTWVAAIGRLEVDGQPRCTAVLVGPDLVLTASYCVASHGDIEPGSFTLTLNYLGAGESAPRYEVAAEPVELVSGMASLELDGGIDYALLRIPEGVGHSGWLPLSPTSPQVGEPLAMVGHLEGGPAQIVDDPSCHVTNLATNRFGHGCASGSGTAGGPIFDHAGRVIGIEFAGTWGGEGGNNGVAIRADRILSTSATLRGAAPASAAAGAMRR